MSSASSSIEYNPRPFEGVDAENNLVAMREILPLATLKVTLTQEYGEKSITLATILPSMAGAMRRQDGEIFVALQTITASGDISRDIASRIEKALELEPGEYYQQTDIPEPGIRLNDMVNEYGELTIHNVPDFWVTPEELEKEETQSAVNDAGSQMIPTKEVEGHTGAYWCKMSREFMRWVRPEPTDQLLDALARLRASREIGFAGSKFAGVFRALGILIPVWELPRGTQAEDLVEELEEFEKKLDAALANTEELTYEELRAREGIVSRQVMIR